MITMTQHPLIASVISRLERQLADARALNHHVETIARVLNIPVNTDYNRSMNISTHDARITLWLTYPHVLASPEDLKKLAIAGYHQRTGKEPVTDKGSGTTTYHLYHRDWKYAEESILTLYANLAEDAPTCRRVKVGERTETYPVYEVQCGTDNPW